MPEADCYCGGFPCQAFSVAGKRGGFEDTRGTLFFEVMRLAAVRKPKYLFMENVAGLLSHDGGKTFGTILNTLGQLGYWYEYQVLNSKNFGVPQNRERVFIIGHLGGTSTREIFPIIKRMEHNKDKKTADYRLDEGLRVRTEGVTPTLCASMNASSISKTIILLDKEKGDRILTSKEFFRLQGFPDELYEKAAKVNQENQLYKQAGNSVTVNVIYEIARRLQDANRTNSIPTKA